VPLMWHVNPYDAQEVHVKLTVCSLMPPGTTFPSSTGVWPLRNIKPGIFVACAIIMDSNQMGNQITNIPTQYVRILPVFGAVNLFNGCHVERELSSSPCYVIETNLLGTRPHRVVSTPSKVILTSII
jgi:hypothetical protein